MKYRIGVKEVWEQMYEVEADSPEDALSKVEDSLYGVVSEAKICENELDLSYTLDSDEWSVYPN